MKHFSLLLVLFPVLGFTQIKEFDKLEMLYDQGHYKMVYRKSKRLLDNPEFDYSLLPKYYKSISIFQLYKDEKWRNRNEKEIKEAEELFLKVKVEDQNNKLFSAHYYEIQSLKRDLNAFLELNKQRGKTALFESTFTLVNNLFQHLPDTTVQEEHSTIIPSKEELPSTKIIAEDNNRKQIVAFAENYLNTPYEWGGETPKGFDCSGFTGYVMHEFGKTIPRTAHDQYKTASKVKLKKVQPGDFVFFDSGSGINHVGIVVSNEQGVINMIHASTSSGVIITNIFQSKYWSKRIKAAGSFL